MPGRRRIRPREGGAGSKGRPHEVEVYAASTAGAPSIPPALPGAAARAFWRLLDTFKVALA